MAEPGFTVDIAVCTRDRADMLARALDSLLRETAGRDGTRILVVDNGSIDATPDLLAELARREPRIVPLLEPTPGLYHARVRAIGASTADILLFIDDDVVPDPGFLEPLLAAFRDPTVGAVGPAIRGLFDGQLPSWFGPRFAPYLPVLPVDGDVENCAYPRFPPGACLALRRGGFLDLYAAPERRDAALGVGGRDGRGHPTAYGEDTDLCDLYARAGFRILRTGRSSVGHSVHTQRLSPRWIIDRFRIEGRTRVRLARLGDRSILSGGAVRMLVGLFVLAPLRLIAGWGEGRLAVLVRAYLAKSLGAWGELLWGRRDLRFPYPDVAGVVDRRS